jgi:hypothetical protein
MGRNKYMFTLHAATNNMHQTELKRLNRLKRMSNNYNLKHNKPLEEDLIIKQNTENHGKELMESVKKDEVL